MRPTHRNVRIDDRLRRVVASPEIGQRRRAEKRRREIVHAAPVDPAALDGIQREVVAQVVTRVIDAIYPVKVIAVNQDGVTINGLSDS